MRLVRRAAARASRMLPVTLRINTWLRCVLILRAHSGASKIMMRVACGPHVVCRLARCRWVRGLRHSWNFAASASKSLPVVCDAARKRGRRPHLWDGHAADRIVAALAQRLGADVS